MERLHLLDAMDRLDRTTPIQIRICFTPSLDGPRAFKKLHEDRIILIESADWIRMMSALDHPQGEWERTKYGRSIRLQLLRPCAELINPHLEHIEWLQRHEGALAYYLPQTDPNTPHDGPKRFSFAQSILTGSLFKFLKEWGLQLDIRFGYTRHHVLAAGHTDCHLFLKEGGRKIVHFAICALSDHMFDTSDMKSQGVFSQPSDATALIRAAADRYITANT